MSRLGYLMLAYGVTWIAIFGYTLALGRRQAELGKELASLQEAMQRLSARRTTGEK